MLPLREMFDGNKPSLVWMSVPIAVSISKTLVYDWQWPNPLMIVSTVKCLKAMLSIKCLGMIHFSFVAATQMSAAKDVPSLRTRSLTVLPMPTSYCLVQIVTQFRWWGWSTIQEIASLGWPRQVRGSKSCCLNLADAIWLQLWEEFSSQMLQFQSRLHGFTYINSWWKNQLALVARLRKPVTELIIVVCYKFCFQRMCGVYLSTHRSIVKMEKTHRVRKLWNLHGYKIIAVTESWETSEISDSELIFGWFCLVS